MSLHCRWCVSVDLCVVSGKKWWTVILFGERGAEEKDTRHVMPLNCLKTGVCFTSCVRRDIIFSRTPEQMVRVETTMSKFSVGVWGVLLLTPEPTFQIRPLFFFIFFFPPPDKFKGWQIMENGGDKWKIEPVEEVPHPDNTVQKYFATSYS